MKGKVKKTLIVLVFLGAFVRVFGQTNVDNWIAKKNQFKPSGDGYPQIIQNEDLSLVHAVIKWGEALAVFGDTDFKKPNHLECVLGKDSISVGAGDKKVLIRIQKNSVTIGKKKYSEKATLVYFQTLLRLLTDLSKDFKCQDVKYLEFSNTVEETRMVIEFDFSPLVVSLDAEFGGIKASDENHNFLDLVLEKDSFFWGK